MNHYLESVGRRVGHVGPDPSNAEMLYCLAVVIDDAAERTNDRLESLIAAVEALARAWETR